MSAEPDLWAKCLGMALAAARRLEMDPRRADVIDVCADAVSEAWLRWEDYKEGKDKATPATFTYLIARRSLLRLRYSEPRTIQVGDWSAVAELNRGWSAHQVLESTLEGLALELAEDVWLREQELKRTCWQKGVRADEGKRTIIQAEREVRVVLEALGEPY